MKLSVFCDANSTCMVKRTGRQSSQVQYVLMGYPVPGIYGPMNSRFKFKRDLIYLEQLKHSLELRETAELGDTFLWVRH